MEIKNKHENPTAKQIEYLESLSRRKGFKFISQAEKECFGKQKIGGMNRQMASDLIEWLNRR